MSDVDDHPITWNSVDLSVGIVVWSACPPGSFDAWPDDQRLFLGNVLETAMGRLGLEDRLEELLRAVEDVAKPHFEKAIGGIEKARLESLKGPG